MCTSARRIATAAALLFLFAPPACAAVEIHWWHAMQGELSRLLEKLAADFNQSQPDYKIVPTGKGLYNETLSAVVLAMNKRQQPAMVQVVEIATATMMAAKGAFYPVFELMRDQGEAFDPQAYLPAVTGYYTDVSGNMLSFPFNASTPILYYSKDAFRKAGLDPERPPTTWYDMEQTGRKLRASGVRCGFTTHWPSWTLIENFSALHNLPIATRANGFDGLDTELTINNDVVVRHVAKLAEWQKSGIFDYGGRETRADAKFQTGECSMFLGTSAARADILAKSRFAVGYGMLPYWPDVADAPQNSIIGGASLWVLRGRTQAEYAGVAKFLAYLSRSEVQARWHQSTGYLPITRAAYDLTRQQGFYDRNPGADISIEQITLHPPTENSKGLRIGSFVLIRDVIENELEQALAGNKPARAALDAAVARGNRLLRLFERAMQ
ncbi:MAG: sn-glycerol-3-phosphate ABC transporter substrate-binding protein UgpB [Xanthobacteraceae bacterium]